MKNAKYIPLLLIPFLIGSCGEIEEDPTIVPTEPSIVEPTEVPTEAPTETPTEAPTTKPTIDLEEAKKIIGNRKLLKKQLLKNGAEPILKMNVSKSSDGKIETKETTIENVIRTKEFTSKIRETKTSKKDNVTVSSSKHLYTSNFNNVLETASIEKGEGKTSKAKRYKIVENKLNNLPDILSVEEANSYINDEINKLDVTALVNQDYWKDYLTSTNLVDTSYELTEIDTGVRVVSTGYVEGFIGTQYEFIANFDYSYKVESGVLKIVKYNGDDWNKETHSPIQDATPYIEEKCSLDRVEYGNPIESGSSPIINLSDYFVEELKEGVVINTWISDMMSGESLTSADNTVFVGSNVYAPIEQIKDQVLYLPAKASDFEQLYITETSNDDAIMLLSDGSCAVANKPGEKVTLSIGNSFNPHLKDIEVTIVENPLLSAPSFTGDLFITDETRGTYNPWDEQKKTSTLEIIGEEAVVIGLYTVNNSPFLPFSLTITTEDENIVTCNIVEDQNIYLTNFNYNAVYLELHPVAKGTAQLKIVDDSTGEAIVDVSITNK